MSEYFYDVKAGLGHISRAFSFGDIQRRHLRVSGRVGSQQDGGGGGGGERPEFFAQVGI